MLREMVVAAVLVVSFPVLAASQCPFTSLPAKPLATGQVDWGNGPVACPSGSPSNAVCYQFDLLDCGGAGPAGSSSGRIRVLPPQAGPAGATAVFLTGGRSVEFWGSKYGQPAQDALTNLRSQGYRTIEVRFLQEESWSTSAEEVQGAMNMACRGWTLFADLKATFQSLEPGSKFCGTANSSGAALLGYVVSHYDDTLFDSAVLTAGPPMSRIDLGCEPPVGNAFSYACGNRTQIDQTLGYTPDWAALSQVPVGEACPQVPEDFPGPCELENLACGDLFEEMSLVSSLGGEFNPVTEVSIILGENDPTTAPVQAEEYATALGIATIEVLGAGHGLPAHPDGALEVQQQLRATCYDPTNP